MHDEKLLDGIGLQILRMLQENARVSFSELGRRVGLSSPAVAERVRRMEEAGYINGYKAVVDNASLGFPITAYISMKASIGKLADADELARKIPEIVEGYHLTGDEGTLFKVISPSVNHLELVINQLSDYGATTTSVVLSSPVSSRVLFPAGVKAPADETFPAGGGSIS
ncbi:MAG: Lrp/AsnC family transcriptional regulator [Synergistaceae bacterium]|jgi:Lrp/AsnC family leucine-responsive transcriptional regulator|nr:Lrp/AsnC family transcriptional regulator [Synergistaceae bacterium]